MLPVHVKLLIYNTLIACHFNQGILVWGNNSKIDRILKLQKKAVRVILNTRYNAHSDPLFKKLGVLKVTDMHMIAQLKFIYNHTRDLLPTNLQSISVKLNSEIHDHYTRQASFEHRTYCHPKSLKLVLEKGLSIFPESVMNGFYVNSLATVVKSYKRCILNGYSDVELCPDSKCVSCK